MAFTGTMGACMWGIDALFDVLAVHIKRNEL